MCTRARLILFVCFYQIFFIRQSYTASGVKNAVKTPSQIKSHKKCTLPDHPKNGEWTVSKSETTAKYQPGMSIEDYQFLTIKCYDSHRLNGDSVIVCLDGKWSKNIGTCDSLCPPLYGTTSMDVTCVTSNVETTNCTEPVTGTTAKINCKRFYEDLQFETQTYMFCVNGKWNKNLPKCVPQCGLRNGQLNTLIVSGNEIKKGSYPWQAAIYQRKKSSKILVCGGSLISQRIVLTAAHCVTKVQDGGLQPKNNYVIGVGKFYRKFNDARDTEAQFSTIQEMFVPNFYSGEARQFAGDIALIITHKLFQLSNLVQPVCMNWALTNFEQELSNPEKMAFAYVSGWGFTTETGNASETLRELKVPNINNLDCIQEFPKEDSRYFTRDKLCAGYHNESASICVGDSGGGLVYKSEADGRFYIIGIVSLAAKAKQDQQGCNSQQYGLYTDVAKYISTFIINKVSLYEDINKENFFKCTSGETIVKDQQCDGLADCQDASDETNSCQQFSCRPDYVRCKYGACLHPGNQCDGKQDCRDNSDEDLASCKDVLSAHQIQSDRTNSQECTLPDHPKNGHWTIFGAQTSSNTTLKPGAPVTLGTILQISCDKPFRLNNQPLIVCGNGIWGPSGVGQCVIPNCPDISSTHKTKITCFDPNHNKTAENCTRPVSGTQAQVKCVDFYEISHGSSAANLTCLDGSWSDVIPVCRPICGVKTNDSYPWQVMVYKAIPTFVIEFVYFCVGSLISERLILTSASCVTYVRDGKPTPLEEFVVAVGKKYHEFNDTRETDFQYSKLTEVIVAPGYKAAESNITPNIAILVTEKYFRFTPKVQPVCLTEVAAKNKGYLLGWNTPSAGFYTTTILPTEVEVPFVDHDTCLPSVTGEKKDYFTDDKFCSNNFNDTTVCYSRNGATLMVKSEADGRYHVTGIISEVIVFPFQALVFDCNKEGERVFYTNMSIYMTDFVLPQVKKYSVL